MRTPWATAALVALIAAFYFALSGGSSYVTPLSRLYPLGVSGYNLIGAITYAFVHIGLKHLIGNMIALAAFGAILEQRLRGTHVIAMFVVAGLASGLAYALMHPDIWVVGASAGIAGLLAASFVADTNRALVALVAVMVLVPNVVLPATDIALDSAERAKLLDAARAQLELSRIGELIAQGNYTNETLEQQAQLQREYEGAVGSRQSLAEGRGTEAATPASLEIHAIGAAVALAFLWVFDRSAFTQFAKRVRKAWRWLVGPYKP